jgi:hypothetical protein
MSYTVIPALGRLRQEDREFEAILGYIIRLSESKERKERKKEGRKGRKRK